MNASPRYEVVRFIPYYNDRDGIDGHTVRRVATTMTPAYAFALRARNDSDGMDESYTLVRDLGTGLRVYPAPTPGDYDSIPF